MYPSFSKDLYKLRKKFQFAWEMTYIISLDKFSKIYKALNTSPNMANFQRQPKWDYEAIRIL